MRVGDIVLYKLTRDDADAIEATGRLRGGDRQAVVEGDVFPAVVIRNYGVDQNLKVLIDGDGDYWAPGRTQGTDHGQWLPKG